MAEQATRQAQLQQPAAASKPRKAPTAAQRAKRRALAHRWLRFGVQAVFFVLAPGLFSGAFNGVKYLFTQIGATAPLELTSFVVLLIAALAFTVLFGRFFCGYACAFGSLGDWLYAAFDFLRSKTPVPRVVFPAGLVKALSLLKYVVLVAICLACFFGAWSSVSGYSPWVAFAAFTSGSLDGVHVVAYALLGVVALGMIVRERFFCQFLCPMGAVFSLMPVLGFSEFTRTRDHCARKCGRCHEVCPVGIWPDADEIGHGECVSCGRCADTCPMANVNLLAIEKATVEKTQRDGANGAGDADAVIAAPVVEAAGATEVTAAATAPRPLRKTKDKWLLVQGTGVPVVLAKAVLLLVLCWMVGATRYLPPLSGGM